MTKKLVLLTTPLLMLSIAAVPTAAKPAPPSGATTTASLGVSATAVAACTLSTTPVAFGTLNPTAATTATGTITVTCTNGDALTIALDAGANANGTQRRLANGSNYLNYALYQPTAAGNAESSPAVTWGDGTNLGTTFAANSTGSAQVFNVYGSVPAGQSLYVGSYNDTVTVTLTY